MSMPPAGNMAVLLRRVLIPGAARPSAKGRPLAQRLTRTAAATSTAPVTASRRHFGALGGGDAAPGPPPPPAAATMPAAAAAATSTPSSFSSSSVGAVFAEDSKQSNSSSSSSSMRRETGSASTYVGMGTAGHYLIKAIRKSAARGRRLKANDGNNKHKNSSSIKNALEDAAKLQSQQFLQVADNLDMDSVVFALSHFADIEALRQSDFWMQAAAIVEPRLPEMNPDKLGLVANAFTRAQATVPTLIDAISARVIEEMGDASTKNLTLVLHAAQTQQATSGSTQKVSEHLAGRVREMNAQDAALYFATINGETPGEAETLSSPQHGKEEKSGPQQEQHGSSLQEAGHQQQRQQQQQQQRRQLQQDSQMTARRPPRQASQQQQQQQPQSFELADLQTLAPPALASLVQAYARSMNKDEQVLTGLKSCIVAQLGKFPPQSLAMVANAYARLGQLDKEFFDILATHSAQALAEEAISTRDATRLKAGRPRGQYEQSYDHIAVAQLLNAHAKARHYHHDFFQSVLDWMSPDRLATFNAQSLGNTLHALAVFPELRRGAQLATLKATFLSFLPFIDASVGDFQVQNLVNITQAFSTVGLPAPESLLAALHERRSTWNTQDVANLASSLARLENWHPELFNDIAERTRSLGPSRFRPSELSSLFNACGHFTAAVRTRQSDDGEGEEEIRRVPRSGEGTSSPVKPPPLPPHFSPSSPPSPPPSSESEWSSPSPSSPSSSSSSSSSSSVSSLASTKGCSAAAQLQAASAVFSLMKWTLTQLSSSSSSSSFSSSSSSSSPPTGWRGTSFETALLLNAASKARITSSPFFPQALLHIEQAFPKERQALATVTITMTALGRLLTRPGPGLQKQLCGQLLHKDTVRRLDVPTVVGLLTSMARLEAAAAGDPLQVAVGPLLNCLLAFLQAKEAPRAVDGIESLGHRRQRRWDARTIPMALAAIGHLRCGCRRSDCPVCGSLSRRCQVELLRRAAVEVGPRASGVSKRQLLQSLLATFHFTEPECGSLALWKACLAACEPCSDLVAASGAAAAPAGGVAAPPSPPPPPHPAEPCASSASAAAPSPPAAAAATATARPVDVDHGDDDYFEEQWDADAARLEVFKAASSSSSCWAAVAAGKEEHGKDGASGLVVATEVMGIYSLDLLKPLAA